MNRAWIKFVAGSMIVGLAAGAFGATANLTEKFTGSMSGWTKTSNGSLVGGVENLGIQFAAQKDIPYPEKGAMVALPTSSGGRFVGDFAAAGITDVSLMFKLQGAEGPVVFFFKNAASGNEWMYPLERAKGSTDWYTAIVPLVFSAAWATGAADPSEATFNADLANVTQIGVRQYRVEGTASMLCTIDNVKLIGPWGGELSADGIPLAWLQEYLSVQGDGYGAQDADGDKFSNYAEYMAGTDPNDAASYLYLLIERDGAGNATLTWNHAPYRKFALWRTSSLTGGFDKKLASGISSDTKGNSRTVVEDGEGPFFYRVEIEE